MPPTGRFALPSCSIAALLAVGCGATRTPATRTTPAGLAPSATRATAPRRAIHGGPVTLSPDERLLLALDPDNGTLTTLETQLWTPRGQTHVGAEPVALLMRDDGRIFVADRSDNAVIAYELAGPRLETLRQVARTEVPTEPLALALAPDGHALYVTSGAGATLSVLDADTLRPRGAVRLAREPRGLVLAPDRDRAFVGHLVGGVLSVVRLSTLQVTTLPLPRGPEAMHDTRHDALAADDSPLPPPVRIEGALRRPAPAAPGAVHPRDTALLARALTLSPDGDKVYVAYTVEATHPEAIALAFDSYYGGVGTAGVPLPATTIGVLDTATLRWGPPARQTDDDFLAPPPPIRDPSWIGVRPRDGKILLTAMGNNALGELDATQPDPALQGQALNLMFDHCHGPVGATSLRDGTTVVMCRFSHELQVVRFGDDGYVTPVVLGPERLDEDVARGRMLYHRANLASISRFGFACASCHPEGRDDGVVWSTRVGPRQTPWLAGRLHDTAPYGWEGSNENLEMNIEATVARVGGNGRLTDADVRALAAYMLRGMHPPRRADTTPTPAPTTASTAGELVTFGAHVFATAGCAGCHDPARGYTDGQAHNVGSAVPRRPGAPAPDQYESFDTPSLRFVGLTPPYFHDGSYGSLETWLGDNRDRMGHTNGLNRDERVALLAFLRTL